MPPANTTPQQWHQIAFILGPWVVGVAADLFLQGILSTQFVSYFSHYNSSDKLGIRLMVIGLVVITYLKSAQSFGLLWMQNVVYFMDLEGALLLNYTTWWQSGNAMIVATMGAYVQCFFTWRLYTLSGRWWIVAPIIMLISFAFLSMILATYYIVGENIKGIGPWFAAHLGTTFAADVVICGITARYLYVAARGGLKQTKDLVDALIRGTFQTAAPAAICAMFNLILSQVYSSNDDLISTAFNMALPKLYAVSMMYTLNSRRTLRLTKTSKGTSSAEISNAPNRRGTARDIELGRIHIHTQVETVRHIDFNDDVSNGRLDRKDDDISVDAGDNSLKS